jgi:hypothetical protein
MAVALVFHSQSYPALGSIRVPVVLASLSLQFRTEGGAATNEFDRKRAKKDVGNDKMQEVIRLFGATVKDVVQK